MNIAAWIWLVVLSIAIAWLVFQDIKHTKAIGALIDLYVQKKDRDIHKAVSEITEQAEKVETEEEMEALAQEIMEKHGLHGSVEIVKVRESKKVEDTGKKKKPTANKKSTNKKGKK